MGDSKLSLFALTENRRTITVQWIRHCRRSRLSGHCRILDKSITCLFSERVDSSIPTSSTMYIPFISATYSLPVFHCTVLYRRILIEGISGLCFSRFSRTFVYTRRSANCPRRHDRFWRRCRCPKWIRGFLDGKPSRSSAWTTDWEEAESKARDMETPAMANAWAAIVAREEMTCRMKGRPSDLDGLPL